MKRSDALKNIGLTAGFIVATPTVLSLFQSCKSDVATWTPSFLTEEQGVVLNNIIDVILPKTDTPSASDVNVAEFIDKYVKEVYTNEEQKGYKHSFEILVSLLKSDYNTNVSKITDANYMNLLDTHLVLDSNGSGSENEDVSEFLNGLRNTTIHAYKISETVGETILAYDPVPGIPKISCMTVEEATGGVAWSLH